MVIAPIVFFGLVGVIVALFGACIYLAYFSKKSHTPHHDERVSQVLVSAEREAEEIVRSSVEKAQETLLDAQYIKDDLMRSIESSMRSIAESAIVSFQEESQKTHVRFQELFEEVATQYRKETEKTVASLEKEAEEEAVSFREELKQEIVVSQKKADARAEAAFAAVTQELEEYKREKMNALDAQVQGMVEKVFVEVLGKSLSSGDHEKLVLDALESAKQDGVLSFLGKSVPEDEPSSPSKNGKLGATEYRQVAPKSTHT